MEPQATDAGVTPQDSFCANNTDVNVKSKRKKFIREEGGASVGGSPVIPANSAGSGAIEGIGVGPKGEPGVNPKRKRKLIPFDVFRRRQPNV